MEFVYPFFLYTSILLGIPLGIHYLNLRRYKKLYFSNVLLLQQIQSQSRSRDKLKKYGLLICRLTAFLLIIFAFAQPYIPSKEGVKSKVQNRLVSVYVDNSYSMTLPGPQGNLLELARQKAREVAMAFDLNTRFQLLTNDFEGRHQQLVYREEFLNLLTQVQVSPLSRTIPDILARQHALLDLEPNAISQSFLISDFQKNMIGGPLKLGDDKLILNLVRLNGTNRRNLYIDSVYNLNKIQRVGEKEKLVIRIKESAFEAGHEPVTVAVQVKINAQLKAVSTVRMTENSAINDTVNYLIQDSGSQKLVVTLTDQPIIFDDHFYGAWSVSPSASIMVIRGGPENKFIRAVYAADPYFNLTTVDENHINYGAIAGQQLIILDQLKNPPTALNVELSRFLATGGNVLFLPSPDQPITGMKRFLSSFNVDLPDTLMHQQLAVKSLNRQSDIFDGVFDKFPTNPTLPIVNFYVRYTERSQLLREKVIRMNGNLPMLALYNLGKGRWYQSAVPFTDAGGTIQRQALFVPLMYQLALTHASRQALYYEIGKDHSLPLADLSGGVHTGLKLSSQSIELIPEVRQNKNLTTLYIGSQVHNDGIYALKNGNTQVNEYAFNYNRNESIMSFFSLGELHELTGLKVSAIIEPGKESLSNQIKQSSLGTQLWKVCLILSLVFLALEECIIWFDSRKKVLV